MPGDEKATEVVFDVKAKEAFDKFLDLYERRTQVFERIAMAMEHNNEQRWHSVR